MTEENKKAGLQKDISSIFAGLEEIDNGRTEKPRTVTEEVPPGSGSVSPADPPPEPLPPLPTLENEPYRPPATKTSSQPMAASKTIVSGGSFPNRRNAYVGLDIGSSSIKLIQLCPVSEGWEIEGYAIQEYKMSGGEEDIVKDEHFGRRLKELCSSVGVRGGVVCSLRGDKVNTGLIQLSRMPKGELASASRLEAGRRVTFNIDKALIRNIAVDKDPARPGGKLNYIVTVVSREVISTILGAIRQAALQAVSLLPVPFAWKDFLVEIAGVGSSTTVAVVDIGKVRTQVCIYEGNRLSFNREFDTGGSNVTEAVIQAGQTFGVQSKISWEEAEEIKKSTNFLQADSMQTLKDNLSASQVAGMVRPVLEKIVQESKRSLEYFRQLYRKAEISQVYLAGGGALSPGFERFFQERLRPPVKAFGIAGRIKLHSSISADEEIEAVFPRLARAAALSTSRRWEVNFIPPLDKALQNILRRKVLILIPIIAIFAVSYLFYQSKTALIPQQEKIVKSKQKQLDGFQGNLAPYQILSDLKKQLVAREKVGLYSSLSQPNWRGILKEFSLITPPTIILSRISSLEGEDPHRILCSGRVVGQGSSLDAGITQFIVRVANSPFFQNVEKIHEDQERGLFSFSCTLVY
jgi:type IV pilus assembly protein PilM